MITGAAAVLVVHWQKNFNEGMNIVADIEQDALDIAVKKISALVLSHVASISM